MRKKPYFCIVEQKQTPYLWTMAAVTKIAAVSYLNTIPFIYGLRHASSLDGNLTLCPPAECADMYLRGEVDVALVPAAVAAGLKNTQIITDYCLGAAGEVRTVVLMSDTPVEKVRRVFLDPHSRTSVQLAGWLAANKWNITPEWVVLEGYDNLKGRLCAGDGCVLIGDKVFDHEGEFAYRYDLAAEWRQATGLPFCFAVWVARKGTPYSVVDELQRAFTFGMEHIYEAVVEAGYEGKEYDAYRYLTVNMDFLFDEQKRRALKKFWNWGIRVVPHNNPG